MAFPYQVHNLTTATDSLIGSYQTRAMAQSVLERWQAAWPGNHFEIRQAA